MKKFVCLAILTALAVARLCAGTAYAHDVLPPHDSSKIGEFDMLIKPSEMLSGHPVLRFVRVSKTHQVQILVPPELKKGERLDGLFLNDYLAQDSGIRWVLSGGLLRSYSPVIPFGFLKASNQILSKWANARLGSEPEQLLDSVICVNRVGRPVILDVSAWTANDWVSRTRGFPSCVQSGPTLVKGGAAFDIPDEGANKLRGLLRENETTSPFFCIDESGDTVVGVAYGKLIDVAAMLKRDASNGPRCVTAVRMAGGETGGLVGRDAEDAVGNSSFRLPDAIAIGDPFVAPRPVLH